MNIRRILPILIVFALLIATTSVAFASDDVDDVDDSDFIDVNVPDEDLDDSDDWEDVDADDSDDDWDDDDDSDDWDDDSDDDWDDEDWDDLDDNSTYDGNETFIIAYLASGSSSACASAPDLSLHMSALKSIDSSIAVQDSQENTSVNTDDNATAVIQSNTDYGILGLLLFLLLIIVMIL